MSQKQTSQTSAILLLAHGTPNVLGEMAEYLGNVTSGRPMPKEVIEELQHRYAQIGLAETPGLEPPPLTKWTLKQRDLLAKALDGTPVYAAMRNWHPYIADVVAQMRADGITRIKALCLAPQNSRTSVGLYRRVLMAAATGMEVEFISGWAENPLLIQAFAERLWPTWALACAQSERRIPILFTAHSVPSRTVMATPGQDTPDPYAIEARRTAALVAESLAPVGLDEKGWYFAFQSQGLGGGPWIGPTVEETLKKIKEEGHVGVVMQPIGFLCDHVEILYDIDIAFKEMAGQLGLQLWRAESLNDSLVLIDALVDVLSGRFAATVDEIVVPGAV
jgi:protoporphyrin/coproporphyrin ferrochelatase